MVTCSSLTAITSAHDRVELIKEDRRWSVMPCKFKQHPNLSASCQHCSGNTHTAWYKFL
eukprot:m.22215 g.22215  ORF g.22215 m.22215 type:complete len:59 (-) comp11218_c0_seq2:1126-1302(-)